MDALTIREALRFVPGLRRQPTPAHVEFFSVGKREMRVPLWYGANRLGMTPPPKEEVEIAMRDGISFRGEGVEGRDQKKMHDEAVEVMRRERAALFHVPTGRGKTMMTIAASATLRRITLIVVDKKHLTNWKGSIERYTDGAVWQIGAARKADVVWNLRETQKRKGIAQTPLAKLKSRKVGDLKKEIGRLGGNPARRRPPERLTYILCTPGMMGGIPTSVYERVGLLVVDEVHRFYTKKRLGLLLSACPEYMLMCSATPEGGMTGFYRAKRAMVSPEGLVFRPDDDPYTFVCVNTGMDMDENIEDAGGKWQSICTSQARSEERNRIQLDWIRRFPGDEERHLVFCWLFKNHIPRLVDLLDKEGIDHAWYAQAKTSYPDAHVLVTTISKGGEGFDQEAVCEGFEGKRFTRMYMPTVKSVALFIQMKGRLVGRSENPYVFMFVDNNGVERRHLAGIRAYVRKNPNASYLELNWDDELPELVAGLSAGEESAPA